VRLEPIFAVVHQTNGSNPRLLTHTISQSHEYCCTKFDETKFSAAPEDTVFMVELGYCDVIEASKK